MPFNITFSVKNWKLAFITLILICLFTSLGVWQIWRAKQKKWLLAAFTERTLKTPLNAHALQLSLNDKRFYRAHLEGYFDNQHTFLLDNKTFQGQVGYEIYTLFYAKELKTPILVDRGFIPLNGDRYTLPTIRQATGHITITGLLNLPPAYVALGKMHESSPITWPLRIEFINLSLLTELLHTPLFPYVLTLEPEHPAAYPLKWQVTLMGPERHIGYALQWFALDLTLLILFVVLNCSPRRL